MITMAKNNQKNGTIVFLGGTGLLLAYFVFGLIRGAIGNKGIEQEVAEANVILQSA
jgi:hypothetical protein